jgi:membrane fusion protein (multidrug efflux system)
MSTTHAAKNKSQKRKILLLNISISLIVTFFIIWWVKEYFDLGDHLYTNDAQVEEYINPVNTRISGYVKEVRFTEHQNVKKGDTLVIIDNSEYKIQLEQAQAAYLSAMAAKNVSASSVNTVQSNLGISDANISAAQARVWNAEQNYHRYQNLLEEGAATQQQFDQVKTEYDALIAQKKALEQQRMTTTFSTSEASRKVTVSDAEIKRAQAAVDMAKLNLSYTIIVAPYKGVTGRRSIQEGQLLQAGQTLLSFVRNGNKWVVANYKETQITHLKIGQQMQLKIDGIDNKAFTGKVAAISEATGSKYSAIPTDNSTGNFIKVRQRIPVRIDFSDASDAKFQELIRAGMNVEVQSVN